MIIPHDHHLTGLTDGVEESCPLSHERQAHHPVFPVHCHAFNDLAAEKHPPVIERQLTQTSFTAVIWCPDSILHASHLSLTRTVNSSKPFPDIDIPDFSPLRAPPSIS